MKKNNIVPSVLSANFLHLKDEIASLTTNGIEWIHYDVMDRVFVPNLTFGPKILADIRTEFTKLKIDIHLMVKIIDTTVEEYLKDYLKQNVNQITFHVEALSVDQIEEFLIIAKKHKVKASLAIKPTSNFFKLERWLPRLDSVLIMSVEPGFGGQVFKEEALENLRKANNFKKMVNPNFKIWIDGGINDITIKKVEAIGIDFVVVGSYLFENSDVKTRIETLINE